MYGSDNADCVNTSVYIPDFYSKNIQQKFKTLTKLLPYLFGALALIHALPAVAVIAPAHPSSLYGFDASDSVLTMFLQHRALLSGILSAALIYASFIPSARRPVLTGTVVSMGGFLVIAVLRRPHRCG